MADDAVEGVAAVGAGRSPLLHNPLDLINAELSDYAGARGAPGLRLGLALLVVLLLAPHYGAVEQSVDVAQLLALAQLQPGHGERFASAPEELQRHAVLKVKFPVQLLAGGGAPDAQAGAGRRNLGVAAAGLLEQALRPCLDRAGGRIANVIDVYGGERILWRQHISDTITVPGLLGRHRFTVGGPGGRIG